jgi:hypothetical protein
MEYDHANIKWVDRPEQIWVRIDEDCLLNGDVKAGYVSEKAARDDLAQLEVLRKITLHRPSLAPIYGGPTLLEALWAEMDRLMESLMTGTENDEDVCGKKGCISDDPCDHPDNGNKYRAAELAWVLAIVTNAYDPSVDRIRAEAVRRWNEQQAETNEQEATEYAQDSLKEQL